MILSNGIDSIPEEFRPLFASMHNQLILEREENAFLRRMLFGKMSERFIKEEFLNPKGTLFNEAEWEACPNAECCAFPREKDAGTGKKDKRGGSKDSGGRDPFPADLPRERIVVDIPDAEKVCGNDGAVLACIGERVVEKLEIEPARFKVIQYVYPQYACGVCDTMLQAKALPCALPQATCDVGLLAHILEQKYLCGLPLYRQEQMFAQMKVDVSRVSLARWVIAAADVLGDIAFEIRKYILDHHVIHADETPVQVLKGTGKNPTSQSYMWTLCSPENSAPAVWYQYFPSRSGECAHKLLGKFKGLLHVDGFEAYNSVIAKNGITRVGCWAHARRKFDTAGRDGADHGKTLSAKFLEEIKELFLIEREILRASPEERLRIRKERSEPIVSRLKLLLDNERYKVPPKSKLGGALTYLDNQWPHLIVFLNKSEAQLSNNRMERMIRPFAVGRRNWLFSDTAKGADASALIYSIVLTAKENGLNVTKYLKTLLREIPILEAHKTGKVDLTPLLPWNISLPK